MSDWATISSLATAGGTLVLAVATFASVRSASRSAGIAELALQERRRPVLMHSRLDDPQQKIMFVDGHWVRAAGGGGAAEHVDGNVYLALSLRNVGAGIGVLQGWYVRPGLVTADIDHMAAEQMRPQTRDLYIPAGDIGLWQGALREPSEDRLAEIATAIEERQPIKLELLYSDQVGGQRTISRFPLVPAGEYNSLAGAGRHWSLDTDGPR